MYNTYHVYPYNFLISYIKHLNNAIECATTLFICVTIQHLIKKDIMTFVEEKNKKQNLYNNKQTECLFFLSNLC